MPINRTIFGIETGNIAVMEKIALLSIAPSLELKLTHLTAPDLTALSINRTIFGIETPEPYGRFQGHLTINRTIFGIETMNASATSRAAAIYQSHHLWN